MTKEQIKENKHKVWDYSDVKKQIDEGIEYLIGKDFKDSDSLARLYSMTNPYEIYVRKTSRIEGKTKVGLRYVFRIICNEGVIIITEGLKLVSGNIEDGTHVTKISMQIKPFYFDKTKEPKGDVEKFEIKRNYKTDEVEVIVYKKSIKGLFQQFKEWIKNV